MRKIYVSCLEVTSIGFLYCSSICAVKQKHISQSNVQNALPLVYRHRSQVERVKMCVCSIRRCSWSADCRFYQPQAALFSIGRRNIQWQKSVSHSVKHTPTSVASIDPCFAEYSQRHVILMAANEPLTFLLLVNGRTNRVKAYSMH